MTAKAPWWSRPNLASGSTGYRSVVGRASARDAATGRISARGGRASSADLAKLFGGVARASIHTEDLGGFAAEALLSLGLPRDLRAGLVRAMWDEVRHSAAFENYAEAVGAPEVNLVPVERLLDILDVGETDIEFAILHVELEALALDTFTVLKAALADTDIGRLYTVVAIDEASHVKLGAEIIDFLVGRGCTVDRARLSELLHAAAELSYVQHEAALVDLCGWIGASAPRTQRLLLLRQASRAQRLFDVLDRER